MNEAKISRDGSVRATVTNPDHFNGKAHQQVTNFTCLQIHTHNNRLFYDHLSLNLS